MTDRVKATAAFPGDEAAWSGTQISLYYRLTSLCRKPTLLDNYGLIPIYA